MDWFLYDNGLRHERVNPFNFKSAQLSVIKELVVQLVLPYAKPSPYSKRRGAKRPALPVILL